MNKIFVKSLLIQAITAVSLALTYQPTFADNHRAMDSSRIKKLVKKYKAQAPAKTEKVTIILNDRNKSGLQNIIKARSGTLRYKSGDNYQVQVPANRLDLFLNSLPNDVTVRLPYPHKTDAVTTSQGVEITGAKDMHDLLIDGAGTKIGVIDMGFTSLSTSQAAGELPAGLSITDYTGTGTDGTNHGTNVAEIVYDMAPGADLYLAKINSNLELEAAVNDMIAAGVQVINHSVSWFGAAFYDGTGPFCDITNTASAAGIIWANAAGNDRQNHYLGTFTDTDSDLLHEFSTNQNYNTITVTSGITYTFILNWDAYPETTIDYDLYLYNGDPALGGSVVDSSTNAQSGGFPRYPIPHEILSYTATYTGTLYIVVKKKDASTPNLPLTLFSMNKALGTRTNSSSLSQPGDCASSLTVGATDLSDVPEYFSSMGPTTDGRNKPDVTGPDRVTTSLSSSFMGTSAAAPNVAGAVALLIQQNPSMTNTDIYNLLTSSPYDIYTPGFDIRTGYGRISLDADSDLFNHDDDNCVIDYNPTQLDTDLDSLGNACDTDDDNDGLLDTFEISIGTNTLLIDTDGDTISDFDEVAFDGIVGAYDPLLDLNPLAIDTDGDSLPDNVDPIPITFNFNDGDLAPLGAPDGQINAADYMIAERMSLGKIIANDLELSHGDLYPQGAPDGVINISDMILIRQLMN